MFTFVLINFKKKGPSADLQKGLRYCFKPLAG